MPAPGPAEESSVRLDPPTGEKWSTTHAGEWPAGFGPGHRDYDDGDGEW